MKIAIGGIVFSGLVALCANSWAAPNESNFDVQLFDVAIGPKSFITVGDARVGHKKQLSFDALVTYLTSPFVIYNFDESTGEQTGERTEVVESLLAGQIVAAYNLLDRLQIGLSIPVVLSMSGAGLDPSNAMKSSDGLSVKGLGDMMLEGKYALLQTPSMALAVSAGMTVPTSTGTQSGQYLGDDLPQARLRGYAQWNAPNGKFAVGTNVGAMFRKPREVFDTKVGQQFTYGLGVAFWASSALSFVAETFGRAGMSELSLGNSPLEVEGGIRFRATPSLSILAGGGAGVVQAIGSPGLRLFLAVGYSADTRDRDHDGVGDSNDKCPDEAEDQDGVTDYDGCPDLDNDGDHRNDDEDKCITEPEDLDGFQDDDGCPELDNDKDGFPDLQDKCPDDVEDKKPPFEKDGCPAGKRDSDDDGKFDDVDKCPDQAEDDDGYIDSDGCPEENDGDGVADIDDKCPVCPEDKDGFDDRDGCPDIDNDQDGVLDALDKCADQAEVINGVNDLDGCPDSGGQERARLDGNKLIINGTIEFARNGSFKDVALVDQVALVMIKHPEVRKWRLVVAAKKERNDDATRVTSKKQADALAAHFTKRGLPADLVEPLGAVSDKPTVVIVATEVGAFEEGETPNFTCPAK